MFCEKQLLYQKPTEPQKLPNVQNMGQHLFWRFTAQGSDLSVFFWTPARTGEEPGSPLLTELLVVNFELLRYTVGRRWQMFRHCNSTLISCKYVQINVTNSFPLHVVFEVKSAASPQRRDGSVQQTHIWDCVAQQQTICAAAVQQHRICFTSVQQHPIWSMTLQNWHILLFLH